MLRTLTAEEAIRRSRDAWVRDNNHAPLAFIHRVLGPSAIAAAGSFGRDGDATTWILARWPGESEIEVLPGDVVTPHVLVVWGGRHRGTSVSLAMVRARTGAMLPVLEPAIHIRDSIQAMQAPERLRRQLSVTVSDYHALAVRLWPVTELYRYLEWVSPDLPREKILQLWAREPGFSAWAAYNAVAAWVDSRDPRGGVSERRLRSALLGRGAAIKRRALRMALAGRALRVCRLPGCVRRGVRASVGAGRVSSHPEPRQEVIP